MTVPIDVTQDQVLAAFLLKLRTDLGLDATNCFEVDIPEFAPLDLPSSGNGIVVTVCAGDGQFPIDEQASVQLAEDSDIYVTWCTRIQLDRASRVANLQHDAQRGILPWKNRILRSLMPTPASAGGNELLLPNGSRFLRDQIFAKSYRRAAWDDKKMIAWASLVFGVNFDWDLASV